MSRPAIPAPDRRGDSGPLTIKTTHGPLLVPALALLAAACSDGSSNLEPLPTLAAHCNPLSTDSCVLPWPSSFYLTPAASTTGYRVNYPQTALPINTSADPTDKGIQLDPARYNLLDGFSIASQILVYFKQGISAAGLPGQQQIASSLEASSLVWLAELGSGQRVPLFVELDANIKPKEVPALIIRPQVPLKYNTRYVVLLRSGIKDGEGRPLAPPEPFRRVRDGDPLEQQVLVQEGARLRDVLAFIDARKLPRSEVLLAWDFHTVSQGAVQGNLTGMVTDALSRLPSAGPGFSDLKTGDLTGDTNTLRTVEGKMLLPSYLASDAEDSWLKLDASGRPVYRGLQKFDFYLHIPRCAEKASAALPVLIFGHGLFGTLKGDITSSWHKKFQNRICMVTAVTPWIGMTLEDLPEIVTQVITRDFSNMPRITDRLQQAQVNAHSLVRLLRGSFNRDRSMLVNGKPVTDGKQVYYLGISNGGNQGVALAALSRDIERFVFNVSGGIWALMIQRSSNFFALDVLLKRRYPSALDRALLISISQSLWDYTDPINFAPHLTGAPLPGQSPRRVILQEARYDDQVPNLSTRIIARAAGLPALQPAVVPVYGLTGKPGPLDSAYAQWNTDPSVKPPPTNVPAPKPQDNDSAHYRVRTLETWTRQTEAFLKPGGRVRNFCDGACDPE